MNNFRKRIVASAALSVALCMSTAPSFAQVVVVDPTAIAKLGQQYTATLQQIATLEAQLQSAQNALALAKQQATGLTSSQWAQYQSMFKTITTTPAFINQTIQQQQSALKQFTTFFPDWKPGATYSTYALTLNENTQAAAQQLLQAANTNSSTFAQEKLNLDSLTQFQPKTQAEQLSVMTLMLRQDVEQMQKLRALESAQASSMGVYYGTMAANQKASIQKSCESQIQSALAIAREMNPSITEAQVRSYYYQQNPKCNAPAP